MYEDGKIHSYIRTNLNNDSKEDYIITFKHSEYIYKLFFIISKDTDYYIQELTTKEEFGINIKFSDEINKNSKSNIKDYDFENIYILDIDNNGYNEVYISIIGEFIPRKLIAYEYLNDKMVNILDTSSNIFYLNNYNIDFDNKTIKVLEYKKSLQYDEYNSLSKEEQQEYSDNLYNENLITYTKVKDSFIKSNTLILKTKREDYY